MPVQLTEPAVVAADRGLYDAHSVIDLAARHDLQQDMTRVARKGPVIDDRRWTIDDGGWTMDHFRPAQVPLDRFADEPADLLFVHGRSTVSTIPTMAASTGDA